MTSPTVQAPAPACVERVEQQRVLLGRDGHEQAAGRLRVEEGEHARVLLGDGAGEPAGGFAAGSSPAAMSSAAPAGPTSRRRGSRKSRLLRRPPA